MNKKSSRILKIIATISSSIILMLFLAFFLTYDFKSEKTYIREYSSSLKEKINTSINNMDEYNTLNINISSKEFDDYLSGYFIYHFKPDNNYLYNGTIWTLKGIETKFKNSNIIITFHANHKRKLNYNLAVTVSFEIKEEGNNISISFNNAKFGAFTLPNSLILDELKDSESKGTIGDLINSVFDSFPFEINREEGTALFNKTYIIDFVKNYYSEETCFEQYADCILEANTNFLTVDDCITLSLNCNEVMNNLSTSMVERIKYVNSETFNIDIYSSLFDVITGEKSTITNTNLINYSLYKWNKTKEALFNVSYIEPYVLNNSLVYDYYVYFDNNYSLISYVFDDSLELKNINIGKDDNDISYITILNKDEFVSIFNKYNSILNNCLSNGIDIALNGDKIIINNETEKQKINNALISDEFYTNIENGLNIGHTDSLTVKDSFDNLDKNQKEAFLNYLKEYFKNDTKVYNYISSILR